MKSLVMSVFALSLTMGFVPAEIDRALGDDASTSIILAASDCEDCN